MLFYDFFTLPALSRLSLEVAMYLCLYVCRPPKKRVSSVKYKLLDEDPIPKIENLRKDTKNI